MLAVGLASGLAIAYVDSLPRWDDSGLLAGGLLVASTLLTGLGYRRPWLMALAVGSWLPLHNFLLSFDPRMFLVLVFPFAGAYTGWSARRIVDSTLHKQ